MQLRGFGLFDLLLALIAVALLAALIPSFSDFLGFGSGKPAPKSAAIREATQKSYAKDAVDATNAAAKRLDAQSAKLKCQMRGDDACPP